MPEKQTTQSKSGEKKKKKKKTQKKSGEKKKKKKKTKWTCLQRRHTDG